MTGKLLCGLAATVFCHPGRFCPAGGREHCPGHRVGLCQLPADWRLVHPLGTVSGEVHACAGHLLEVAAAHPLWTQLPYSPAAYTQLRVSPPVADNDVGR